MPKVLLFMNRFVFNTARNKENNAVDDIYFWNIFFSLMEVALKFIVLQKVTWWMDTSVNLFSCSLNCRLLQSCRSQDVYLRKFLRKRGMKGWYLWNKIFGILKIPKWLPTRVTSAGVVQKFPLQKWRNLHQNIVEKMGNTGGGLNNVWMNTGDCSDKRRTMS